MATALSDRAKSFFASSHESAQLSGSGRAVSRNLIAVAGLPPRRRSLGHGAADDAPFFVMAGQSPTAVRLENGSRAEIALRAVAFRQFGHGRDTEGPHLYLLVMAGRSPTAVRFRIVYEPSPLRHGRPCAGHPRLLRSGSQKKPWMLGTGPSMTEYRRRAGVPCPRRGSNSRNGCVAGIVSLTAESEPDSRGRSPGHDEGVAWRRPTGQPWDKTL